MWNELNNYITTIGGKIKVLSPNKLETYTYRSENSVYFACIVKIDNIKNIDIDIDVFGIYDIFSKQDKEKNLVTYKNYYDKTSDKDTVINIKNNIGNISSEISEYNNKIIKYINDSMTKNSK